MSLPLYDIPLGKLDVSLTRHRLYSLHGHGSTRRRPHSTRTAGRGNSVRNLCSSSSNAIHACMYAQQCDIPCCACQMRRRELLRLRRSETRRPDPDTHNTHKKYAQRKRTNICCVRQRVFWGCAIGRHHIYLSRAGQDTAVPMNPLSGRGGTATSELIIVVVVVWRLHKTSAAQPHSR